MSGCRSVPLVAGLAFGVVACLVLPPGAVPSARADEGAPAAPRPAPSGQPAPPASAVYPRDDFAPTDVVYRVKGDDVNVRGGPSVDHPAFGQLAQGSLVVGVRPREGETDAQPWTRIKIPGGVVVYVFSELVERKPDGLLGRVRGDDVLLRSEQARARLPLSDQRLARGDTLLVIGEKTDDDGVWLQAVAPERTYVWMHGDFLTPIGTVAERRAELDRAAEARVDALSGGKTRSTREAHEHAVRSAFRDRLAPWRAVLTSGAVTEAHVEACRTAVGEAPDAATRGEAQRLLQALTDGLAARRLREARAAAERDSVALDESRRRAEAERRRLEAEREEAKRRQRPDRGAPAAEGRVVVREGKAWLDTQLPDGRVHSVELRSAKYSLVDYDGKRIRIWGARGAGGAVKVLRVDVVEVVPDGE